MRERVRLTVATLVTVGIAVLFGIDTLAWRSAGESWLHSDGIIHLERMQLYAAALRGDPVDPGVRLLVGYGPIPYQAGATVMNLTGHADWATASLAWVGFGVLGVLGTALLAARLGGAWAGPAAAALLVGLPAWRTHSVDMLVDGPGAATAVVALALLAWSDGLRRPGWALAAGLATGTALVCRWPNAALLGPVWAGTVVAASVRADGSTWARVAGVLAVGGLTIGGLLLPLWGLSSGLSMAARVPLVVLAGGAGLAAAVRAGRAPSGWLLRALGAGLGVLAASLPAVLWSPNGFVMGMESQVSMEDSIAGLGDHAPGIVGGLGDALTMLVAWWTGPIVAGVVVVGTALALRRRPVTAGLVVLGAVVNLLVPLELLAQPDERHLFASLPVGVALAGAVATGRAGPFLAAALGSIGLMGLLAWHMPSLPGVISSQPWKRDINLVREVRDPFGDSGWTVGTAPWRSVLPAEGNPYATAAGALVQHFGTASGCLAWVSQRAIRDHLPFHAHVHRMEPPLLEAGSRLQGEDPYDRPGAALAAYDGAVVWAAAGSDLPDRVAETLGGATMLAAVPLQPAFDAGDVRLHVLVAPGRDWAPDGCGSRFPGTGILPLGHGWLKPEARVEGLQD